MIKQDSSNLDVLRSVAVLLVLFAHFLEAFGIHESRQLALWGVLSLGKFGVQLFFIHTSLVLMMSLARLESGGGGALFGRFYIRRVFRIYPLSICAVLAVIFLQIPSFFGQAFHWPSPLQLWSNLLLIQNITRMPEVTLPLWSLPFELQMYVLLPFVYLLGKRIGRPVWIVLLGMAVWQAEHRLSLRLGYPRLLDYAPYFFLGMAIFYRRPKRRLPAWAFPASLGVLILVHCLCARVVGDYRAGWPEWVFCLAFCMLLPNFGDVTARPVREATKQIAKYSYSIYLAHLPLMWLVFTKLSGQPVIVRLAIFWTALAAISVVLYHAIEEPFIRLGGRAANALSRRPVKTRQPDVVESVP